MWVDASIKHLISRLLNDSIYLRTPFDALQETTTNRHFVDVAKSCSLPLEAVRLKVVAKTELAEFLDPALVKHPNHLNYFDILRDFNRAHSKFSDPQFILGSSELPKRDEIVLRYGKQIRDISMESRSAKFVYSITAQIKKLRLEFRIYGDLSRLSSVTSSFEIWSDDTKKCLGHLMPTALLADWGPYNAKTKSEYTEQVWHAIFLSSLIIVYFQRNTPDI